MLKNYYMSKDFKITGDGETKAISREEWLELFRSQCKKEDDVTIIGYDTDGWIVLYQGNKEMRFHQVTMQNLSNFSSTTFTTKR
jgi:hypothetical protein